MAIKSNNSLAQSEIRSILSQNFIFWKKTLNKDENFIFFLGKKKAIE